MSQDTTAASTPAEGIVVEDGYKVFVGNLSFQTTEEELAALFSKPTPVLKANIITRGTRSLGYGFVAYETLAQAEQAVSLYNKTELGGREINVEVAKPKVERTPAQSGAKDNKDGTAEGSGVRPRSGRGGRRGRGGRFSRGSRRQVSHYRKKTQNGEGNSADQSTAAGDSEDKETKDINSTPRRGGRRPRRGGRGGRGGGRRGGFSRRGGRSRSSGGETGGWNDAPTTTSSGANDGWGETPATTSSGANDGWGEAPTTSSKPTRSTRPNRSNRSTRPARSKVAGPPSKTTIFVANLPFSMDDDGLKALFTSFKVVSAHVVRRRGSGRSKGFGFVELADEAEQKSVIEKSKELKADGRELVIKIALSEEHKDDKKDNASSGASSPASSA